MPYKLNPSDLPVAVLFYEQLLNSPDPANPHGFPVDPHALADAIQAAAGRVNRLDDYSAKLERITKASIKAQGGAAGGAKPDFGVFPSPNDEKIQRERDLIDHVRRQYEPIPKGSDPAAAAKGFAKVIGEASILAGLHARGIGLGIGAGSQEFKTMQAELEREIEADHKDLANNPFFQRYAKDYPLTGDAITAAFTGPAALGIIPARELATFSLIAAKDPEVRAHVKNWATMQGGEDELHLAFGAAMKRIEQATFSKEVQQTRFPMDILLTSALTSPVFLKAAGLPPNLPQNLVVKAMSGVKSEALSLRELTKGSVIQHVIDVFRDKRTVQASNFLDSVTDKIAQSLGGGETAKEAAQLVRQKVEAEVGEIATSASKREEIGQNIFRQIYDIVRSRVADLTPSEKAAVVYRVQGRKDVMPQQIKFLYDTDRVGQAADSVKVALQQAAEAEGIHNPSPYWPAYKFLADDLYPAFRHAMTGASELTADMKGELLTKASGEFHKMERVFTDVVHANADNVENVLDNLVFRLASPRVNSIVRGASNDARTIAALVMTNLDDTLARPEQFRVVSEALKDTAPGQMGLFSRAVKAYVNTAYLTLRAGAWATIDSLDSAVSASANVMKRAKSGQAISLSQLIQKTPIPADIIDNSLNATQFAQKSTHPWQWAAFLENMNNVGFRFNKMLDNFRASQIYKLNYGSELKQISGELGIPIDKLPESATKLATQRAIDSTREFALTYSFNSALTTHWASQLAWPYLGFYTKAAGRLGKNLGDVPELFKAGAFGLAKVREMNAEYPQDWQKESMNIKGFSFNLPRKLVSYPVLKMFADSYFGAPQQTDEYGRLEAEAAKLEGINDPQVRMQILDNNPRLQDFMVHRTAKSFGNVMQSVIDMQTLPLGVGVTIPLRMADLLSSRTPHIIPGGRPLTQVMTAFGLQKFDPESFLFPSVAAWNQETLDADVQTQMALMYKRGEAQKFLDSGGPDALVSAATRAVRTRTLVETVMNRLVGTGRQIKPEEQKLFNDLQRLRDRADLLVPTDAEVENITKRTGITNLDQIDMVWKESYLRTFGYEQKLRETRRDLLNEMPELRPFEATFRSRRENLNEQAALEDVRDRYDVLRALPFDQKGAYVKTDRILQAFTKLYNGRIVVDQDGNGAFELSFDGNDVVGPTLYNWMTMTPQERLDKFKQGGPENRTIEQFWPKLYDELRYQSPPLRTDGALPQNDTGRTLLKLAVQPIQEVARSEKVKQYMDLFRDLHPENPLDFPKNAFDAYASRNQEQIKAFIDKGRAVKDKTIKVFNDFIGQVDLALRSDGTAEAAESSDQFGVQSDRVKNIREMLSQPRTPDERASVAEYKRRLGQLSKHNLATTDGWNDALREFRVNFQPYSDMMEMIQVDPIGRKLYHMIGEPMRAGNTDKFKDDFRGLVVGESMSNEYMATKAELMSALTDGNNDPKFYANLKRKMTSLGEKGKTYWDGLRNGWPDMADEVDLRIKGHQYQLGYYSLPNFGGQQALRERYFDLFFSKPGETKLQWDARVRETIPKMDSTEYQRMSSFLRDKSKSEIADALQKVRDHQYTVLPLDRNNVRLLDSAKDYILSNRDDTPGIYTYLNQNPDLTELMKRYDPRTFRTAEGIVFHDTDQSYSNYMKASGYDPEALDYYRRHAPRSFARQFDGDPAFRSLATSLGFGRPEPDAAFAGQTSFASAPEPIAPDPVPDGIFSNLPNTLNYIAGRARREASVLMRIPRDQMTVAEQQFVDAPASSQVFMAFPGVIGQAFREGKLGPQEVIGQFKGLADYGRATGAIDENHYGQFAGFLADASTVTGATNFGFKLGQFLDDTFNTPRIPIQSKTLDFLLAGGPVSGGAPVRPGTSLNLISPIDTALVGSRRDPFPNLGPGQTGAGEAALPSRGEQATQAGAATTGAASAASVGLPPLAAVFAIVSAGFTVANLIQSSRSRSKAKKESQKAQAEQEKRIREAQMAAEATARESEARQIADQRASQLQQEQRQQERDFAERSNRFLQSGANFATFAQQPREFQARFIDRFEPELLKFSRRPQFDSKLNLIASIQGRLPRLRY